MYIQIDGMMTAEEAADSLVFHANNIANAIKRSDNCVFENRVSCVEALLDLLGRYVQQERAVEQASKQAAAVAA